MENTKIEKASIIVPAKNEGVNVKMTVESFLQTSGSIPFELIVVNDASEDDCCRFLAEKEDYWQERGVRLITTDGIGAANARNLGAASATGDILVFSDAHVVVGRDWLEKMAATMVHPSVGVLTVGIADFNNPINVGFGQTWNKKLEIRWLKKPSHICPVPLSPGGLVAFKKEVFRSVGGFETGFKIWGYEDVELSFKCWLFGFGVYVTPYVTVRHIFRNTHTYYVSFDEVNYNLMRMAISHFNPQRLAKTIDMIKIMPNIEKALAEITLSDVWEQRRDYFARRKHDNDWFMNKFKIPY